MNNSDIKENNSRQAFTNLGQFLEADGWHPKQLEGKHIYRMGFSGKNGELTCYAQIRPDLQQFIFYAIVPVKVEEAARLKVAEFITRVNYGVRIGNFEMDFNDGEIRYKSSLDFEGETLTPKLIKNTLYPAVMTTDEYLPGLMSVMYGEKSPQEAVEQIEAVKH